MSFEKEHIDKIIKSKMDNLEIVPDDILWNNLEKTLLKNKTNAIRTKIVGAGVLVVGLCVAWFLYHAHSKEELKNKQNDLVDSIQQQVKSDSIVIHKSTLAVKSNNKSLVEQNQNSDELESASQPVQDSVDKVKVIVNTSIAVDTVPQKAPPAEKVVVKKVIKKPVYVVQQDTIFKVDTLSKKKKR